MFTSILKSVFITCVISILGGLLGYVVGFNPYKTFIVILVLQLSISFIVRQLQFAYFTTKNKEIETARITEFSKQGLDVECAYCHEQNFIPLRFDIDNNFDCDKCKETNSVYINVTSAQITTPLNISQITSTSFKDDQPTIQ